MNTIDSRKRTVKKKQKHLEEHQRKVCKMGGEGEEFRIKGHAKQVSICMFI